MVVAKAARLATNRAAVRTWQRDTLVWVPHGKFFWPAVVGGYKSNPEASNAKKVRVRFLDMKRTVGDICPESIKRWPAAGVQKRLLESLRRPEIQAAAELAQRLDVRMPSTSHMHAHMRSSRTVSLPPPHSWHGAQGPAALWQGFQLAATFHRMTART